MYSDLKNNRMGAAILIPTDKTPARGDSPIRRFKRKHGYPSVTLYDTALTKEAYGASKSVPTQPKRKHSPIRVMKSKHGHIPITLYDTALTMQAYGRSPQLGDIFNDVMGAVVPGWDKRPDWMKKINVKPDPSKLLQTAAKVVPQAEVGRVLDQANKAGFNMFYQTPVGSVPINSQTAGMAMSGYPIFSQAKSAIESVPWWAWAAGAGGLVLLFVMMRK